MHRKYNIENNINGDKMKDIYSKFIVTNKNTDKIYEVAKNMLDYNIGFIPIVKSQKIIGVITDRDITTRIVANKIDLESSIDNYITKNLIYIDINKSIMDAKTLMEREKVKRLLVTDNNKLIGIISISDIIIKLDDKDSSTLLKNIFEKETNIKYINSDINDFYL